MAKITAPQCHRRTTLSYRSFFYIHSHFFFFSKKSFSSKFIFAPRILMIFSSGGVCFIFIWLFFLSWINKLYPDDTSLVLLSRKAYQHFHVNKKKIVYTIRTVTQRRARANKRALAHFSISWILRIGVRLLQLRWYVKPIPIHFHLTYLHSPYIFNIHPYYTP